MAVAFTTPIRIYATRGGQCHSSRSCHHLQAATVAAVADRAIVVNRDMAQFTSGAAAATVNIAVDDQPTADARGNLDIRHIYHVARRPILALAARAHVGVVIE